MRERFSGDTDVVFRRCTVAGEDGHPVEPTANGGLVKPNRTGPYRRSRARNSCSAPNSAP